MENDARRKVDRWVGAASGLFFAGMAVAIMIFAFATNPIGACAAAFVVGGLGIDVLFAAFRNRSSLLSRIGPLP